MLAEYLIVYIFAIFHGEEKSLQIFAVYAVSITLLLGGSPASSRKEEIAQRVFLQKDIKERKSNVQCSKGGSLLDDVVAISIDVEQFMHVVLLLSDFFSRGENLLKVKGKKKTKGGSPSHY